MGSVKPFPPVALTSQLFAYFLEQALGCMLVQLSYLPPGRVQWPQ